MFLHRFGKSTAPELPKNLTWVNSDAMSLKSLRGKVVLFDFWTYSCLNCIKTLPKLKQWQEMYKKQGLQIIGIHTPEFSFEKDKNNVQKAIKKFGINYPVVLDNNYKIWNLYHNRWWPRVMLINKSGHIIYDHIGEGGYAETEMAIQKALLGIGAKNLPVVKPDMSVGGGFCYRITPEIYLGFMKGYYGNVKTFVPNIETDFSDKEIKQEDDTVYLYGHWKVGKEKLTHSRKLPQASEYLSVKYSAFSVYLISGSINHKSIALEIELDGGSLSEDMIGDDIKIINGKSILNVKEYRIYNIVSSTVYHQGKLKIKTEANNIEMFAITFNNSRGV